MKFSWSLLAAACASVLALTQPALAGDSFVCPARPLEASQSASIRGLLPTGDAFDNVARLNAAVTALRAQGVGQALIIDNLIAAYCPVVAADASLSNAQKTARVGRFAARATRVVYALNTEDEIILDVGFPPAVLSAINAKAAAAGVSSETWIQNAVSAALK